MTDDKIPEDKFMLVCNFFTATIGIRTTHDGLYQSWCGFSSEHVFLDEKEGSAVSHAIVMFSRAPLLVVTWLLVKAI